jgi:hypothetical protein
LAFDADQCAHRHPLLGLDARSFGLRGRGFSAIVTKATIPARFWWPSLLSGDVALFFTFVVLVNAPLGTRGTFRTRTLHLAVKVNLTTVNDTLRPIVRCGCFGEEKTAAD